MRNKRRGARHFLPWDKMQLSEKLDSGLRVNQAAVALPIYRVKGALLRWAPLAHAASLLAYRDGGDVLELLNNLTRELRPGSRQHVTFEVYDLTTDSPWAAELLALDDAQDVLRYHPWDEGLPEFLEALEEHQTALRSAIRGSSVDQLTELEPSNKRVQLLVVLLDAARARELAEPETAARATALLRSPKLRLPTFTCVPDLATLPRDFLRHMDLIAALGDANAEHLLSVVYPNRDVSDPSVEMEQIGAVYSALMKYPLSYLHGRRYVPSPWRRALDEKQQKEWQDYQDYLARLDDGSDTRD